MKPEKRIKKNITGAPAGSYICLFDVLIHRLDSIIADREDASWYDTGYERVDLKKVVGPSSKSEVPVPSRV